MVDQGSNGRWHGIAGRLANRGIVDDFLNNPGAVISQVLSPPAATTQEPAKQETRAAETTKAPAASTQAAPTTQAAAAPPPTTTQQAQQPASTPAPAASSPKQETQQKQPQTPTPAPPAPAPATTEKQSMTAQQQQQPTTAPAANPPANNPGANSPAAASSAAAVGASSSANAAVTATTPSASEVAASSEIPSQPVVPQASGGLGIGGAEATKTVGGTSSTQTPQAPNNDSQTSGATNQGPLVAAGVVLGVVVFMGISLLLFWCYRRKRRAARHHHEAVPPESPVNDHTGPGNHFDDYIDQSLPPMTQNSPIDGQDQLMAQHPQPQQAHGNHAEIQPHNATPRRTNPYHSQLFTYAQAQQYVQSHGAFSHPVPPIPEQPSPIRIFRWPTRSSRSGSIAPSIFSSMRSPKPPSRAMSRASRSTMSSMLWHGRRDVIARRTMNQTPVSQRGHLTASSLDSPMPEGLHTPILDWLHWIRGHQNEEDPELNHRKSVISTSESSFSEGSIASSGVFSPTLLSWPPPSTHEAPGVDAEALAFLPMPLQLKRQSSNGETVVEPSSSRIHSYLG